MPGGLQMQRKKITRLQQPLFYENHRVFYREIPPELFSVLLPPPSRVLLARIIGARGKGIRKIMDEFKVDLRFPQSGAADPNLVTVTGRPELVDEAIDHLLNLEEEFMADAVENEAKMAYMRPHGGSASAMDEQRGPSKGFVVREAPWTEQAPDMSSSEDFPSFGAPVAPKASPWGPKRF